MGLENDDGNSSDKDSEVFHESPKEFIMSLSELDFCKEVPNGFGRSVLRIPHTAYKIGQEFMEVCPCKVSGITIIAPHLQLGEMPVTSLEESMEGGVIVLLDGMRKKAMHNLIWIQVHLLDVHLKVELSPQEHRRIPNFMTSSQ